MLTNSLGDAEFVGALEYFTLRYLDSVDHPYALFTFRYRPEGEDLTFVSRSSSSSNVRSEMLKAQGIIPLPVPLVPTSTGDVRTVKKQEPNTTEAFLLDGPYMENGDVKPVIAHDEPDELRALKVSESFGRKMTRLMEPSFTADSDGHHVGRCASYSDSDSKARKEEAPRQERTTYTD